MVASWLHEVWAARRGLCRGSPREFMNKVLTQKNTRGRLLKLLLREEEVSRAVSVPLSSQTDTFCTSSFTRMRNVAGKHLLCLLLLVFPLSWAEFTKKDARMTENDTGEPFFKHGTELTITQAFSLFYVNEDVG